MIRASTRPATRAESSPAGLPVLAVAAVCLAQFLSVLDGFIVSVALPEMQSRLQIARADLQWVPNAYGLVYGGLLLISGRLADRFGRRRVFRLGLWVLVAGSVVAAVAPGAGVLLAGRAIQGAGTAVALPAGMGLLVAGVPEGPRRTRALGLITLSGGIGMVSAGAFGGLLTGWLGWRAVFWFPVPITLLAIGLLAVALRGRPDENRPATLNVRDAALSVMGLAAVVYAGSRVAAVGLASPQVWGVALLGALALVAFWVSERRSDAPLVPAQLLSHPPVRAAGVLALLFPVGFIAPQFLGTQVLQGVLGLDPTETGFAYLPLAVVVLGCTSLAARLTDRVGPRPVSAAGFLILTVGLAYLVVTLRWSYWTGFLPATCAAGAGVTAVFVALAVASVQGVREGETGLASGLFNTSQQVGGALVLALVASVAAGRASLATGLQAGLAVSAAVSALGVVGSLVLMPARPEPRSGSAASSV